SFPRACRIIHAHVQSVARFKPTPYSSLLPHRYLLFPPLTCVRPYLSNVFLISIQFEPSCFSSLLRHRLTTHDKPILTSSLIIGLLNHTSDLPELENYLSSFTRFIYFVGLRISFG